MSKLASILGESVDELEKSLNPEQTDEDELDALIKSLEGDDDEDSEQAQEQDDEDEDMEKSLEADLMKSMSDESIETIDVSDFLGDLVKSINTTISTQMGAVAADQLELGKGIAVIARAMQAQNDLIKSLQEQVEEIGATPRGRRSAVTTGEVKTAQRQGGEQAPSDELQKSQVMTLLNQGFEQGSIPLHKITSFEMGYQMDQATAKAVGIDPAKNRRWVLA